MFVISKRLVMISGAFLALFTAFFTVIVATRSLPKTATVSPAFKIVIDAGHGGVDGGVSGRNTGISESEINLEVAKKIALLAKENGYEVALTRSSSAGLYGTATTSRKKKDMLKRKEIIEREKPDLVISVHMNYFSSSTRKGAQVFYKDGSLEGQNLAQILQNNLNALPNSERDFSALKGDYYILNCSPYTSVLVECGFLSNPEEELLLISEEYQTLLAKTIMLAVNEYRALKVSAK